MQDKVDFLPVTGILNPVSLKFAALQKKVKKRQSEVAGVSKGKVNRS